MISRWYIRLENNNYFNNKIALHAVALSIAENTKSIEILNYFILGRKRMNIKEVNVKKIIIKICS